MDLIDDPAPGQNAPEFSVSEISGAVKRVLEGEFGRIRVRGEVGRVVRARSGHMYFDVKDDRNALACTTWKGQVARLSVLPEEGMEVVVTGRMSAFGGQSKYNLNVDDITVAGEGALMAMLEKRKKALAAEGLFDDARKRPLPYLPEVIGVVTSPSGAVIRDILHRLRDRFPRKVLVWPVAVQGKACAPEVARAIAGFNALTPGGALPRPDLLIVARGGGSIEDLWGFNEELVARAAVASDIPLISAVGHETDTTLIDFVSDRRAPTPTAAAEMAVPVRLDLIGWVEGQGARASAAMARLFAERRQRLTDLARALPRPESLVAQQAQRLDLWSGRLSGALRGLVQARRVTLVQAAASLRPQVLARQVGQARAQLETLAARRGPALDRALLAAHRDCAKLAERLSAKPLRRDLAQRFERLGTRAAQLQGLAQAALAARWERLTALDRLRQTLGYRETLKRGYAVVRAEGQVVTSSAAAATGAIEIEFQDGRVKVGEGSAGPAKAKPKAKPKDPEQGSLF